MPMSLTRSTCSTGSSAPKTCASSTNSPSCAAALAAWRCTSSSLARTPTGMGAPGWSPTCSTSGCWRAVTPTCICAVRSPWSTQPEPGWTTMAFTVSGCTTRSSWPAGRRAAAPRLGWITRAWTLPRCAAAAAAPRWSSAAASRASRRRKCSARPSIASSCWRRTARTVAARAGRARHRVGTCTTC